MDTLFPAVAGVILPDMGETEFAVAALEPACVSVCGTRESRVLLN